ELGDEQADVGDEGDEQQGCHHAQIEGHGRLDDGAHGPLGHGCADEQDRADRRRQQADAAVQHDDDAKLDGVDADRGGNGQQDGGGDQDDGRHIHDAAQEQQDQVDEQGQQDRVVGHAGDGVGRQVRHVQGGHAVAEHVGGCDQDQDDGQGVDRAVQLFPDALQVQALVDEQGDEQGVEHGDGGGLGGGEPAGGHAHHNDDDRAGRPDGLAQLVDQVLDAEFIAAGVVVFDGQDVDAHHQADGQDAAGEVAGQEQAAHRDAAGGGGVDDHVVAGRHQDALHRRGDGDGGGKVGVVALVHHHGDQDGAQGG